MRPAPACTAFLVTTLVAHLTRAGDSSAAVDELKQGYTLKQQGNCREALPHFMRSFELDAKPKAALNLADCELQLGDLVAAQGYAGRGRQLAHSRTTRSWQA
jgi:thioredoxin-like negative regulator of GroEL